MIHRAKIWVLWLGVWSIFLISLFLLSGCETQNKPRVGSSQTFVQPELHVQEQSETVVPEQPRTPVEEQPKPQVEEQPQAHVQKQPQTNSQSELSNQQSTHQPIRSKSQSQSSRAIPVLYYHSIDREVGNELRIPAEEFEAHMKFLHEAGFQSVTLHELYQHYYEGLELPEKPFALTFDDGYADNYSNAFQIAKRYGFTGTVFMVTDWIDGAGYLSKEQLREMSSQGWQIEAHTASHPKLNEIDSKKLERELVNSKRELEEILNLSVKFLAYPYGIYTEQIIQEAREVGYVMGFTTERGWAEGKDPFLVQRVYCYANMGVDELKRRVENPNY